MIVSSRLLFLVAMFFVFVVHSPLLSEAASPQILLSWEAVNSYVPADYPGKALPSPLSPVVVKVGVFEDGKKVDLSEYSIRWYLDEYSSSQGKGVTSFNIPPSLRTNKDSYNIRVELLDYDPGSVLVKSVSIPIVNPKIVISGGKNGKRLSFGANSLVAKPFYFNINQERQLRYSWTMGGASVREDSTGILKLDVRDNLKRGDKLEIGVVARSSDNELERAVAKNIYIVE